MEEADWVEFAVVWGKNLMRFELRSDVNGGGEEEEEEEEQQRERVSGGLVTTAKRRRATCRNY